MIPELLLEEILLGEKDERDYYEKYGKAEIQAALAELRKSDEEILAQYSMEKMKDEIIKKGFESKNEAKNTGKNILRASGFIKYAAAAVLIFAFGLPLVMNTYKSASPAVPSERVKGAKLHHQIRLYRQENGQASLLKNGEEASENDLIQITYLPGQYKYGVIFSVDGKGNVTRHFPEESWTAGQLAKTGEEVPLSFSYALDDAPDYECFIFAASKSEFELSNIEEIDKNSFSIDFLKKGSYLPNNCDGSIFVLRKK